ncbi:MAG: pyrroline-5-carboxylate reductase [Myxococcota bacterium]
MSWTLGFVGTGVMAEVMIAGLLDEGVLPPERIVASHRRADRVGELARYGVRATLDNREAAGCDLVVLSVKPQTLPHVLPELRGAIPAASTLLSIVAGARTRTLRDVLGHARVVRAMPNLPCRIRRGMTVWYGDDADVDRVAAILGVMGEHVRVDDEEHVDRATAVSGTGPAIVAHFIKGFVEAAGYVGEPRKLARDSVYATLAGTLEMLRSSDAHVAELIDEVTSPGGTTSRALQELKNGRFSAVLTESVDAAYQRTKALGDDLEAKLGRR